MGSLEISSDILACVPALAIGQRKHSLPGRVVVVVSRPNEHVEHLIDLFPDLRPHPVRLRDLLVVQRAEGECGRHVEVGPCVTRVLGVEVLVRPRPL